MLKLSSNISPCTWLPASKRTVLFSRERSANAIPATCNSLPLPNSNFSTFYHLQHHQEAHSFSSPRLSTNWKEYQGVNNWDGLLDPLDHNLRSEILRYGNFVEAAYRSFDFQPSSSTYATCKFPRKSLFSRSGITATGYRITKNLRATCGIPFPHWIDRAPSWISTRSSWIGYVAVCHDKDEIARLGRRDVVIAYRGTATCMEWLENLRATLTALSNVDVGVGRKSAQPMVESGFLSLYTSRTATCPSLQHMIRDEVNRIIETYGDEPLSITITGHSLGAALATLTAYDINSAFVNAPMVTVISFGGPRVGNQSFRCQLERSGTRILRIVNSDDLVTKVPGFVTDNNDVADKEVLHVAKLPGWLEKLQLDYVDVGQELRLSSRESPYLSKANMATCHELSTYLHLVNGFVSSTCPFKETARRALRMHQREKLQKLGFR